jgi:hypothetical protein
MPIDDRKVLLVSTVSTANACGVGQYGEKWSGKKDHNTPQQEPTYISAFS